MHDTVPSAVSAAVSTLTMTCITVFHVAFFINLSFLLFFNVSQIIVFIVTQMIGYCHTEITEITEIFYSLAG